MNRNIDWHNIVYILVSLLFIAYVAMFYDTKPEQQSFVPYHTVYKVSP